MAQVVRFGTADGSSMLVEVDDNAFGVERVARRGRGGVIDAGERLEEVLARAMSTVRAVTDSVRTFAPDEYEVEFGLKLNAEAGAMVARTAVEGHFTIKLAWQRGAGHEESRGDDLEADRGADRGADPEPDGEPGLGAGAP